MLPAPVRAVIEAVKTRFLAMSRPMRVFVVSTALATMAITGYVGYRTNEPNWSVLFTNLEKDDAAQVLAKLKERKVPYKLEGDGATILVPDAQARELRLELAGSGLPRGGNVGFESFDKTRLGTTDFEQKILYRRALEGELARTIQTLSPVESVRVHLVLPERSVFVAKNEPASASVVVKLRGGRALGSSEIASVVHLVAASIAGLTPDHVAVVTTDGQVLHRPKRAGDDPALGGEEPGALARSMESSLEERARAMLDRVLGPGRSDVRVSADLDMSRTERTEEHFDPKQVIRSEEKTTEKVQDEAASATGVPGTESNLPNGGARGGGKSGTESVIRESATRNYEVDRVAEKKTTTAGSVRRLTVAIAVDAMGPNGQPRSKEELERIASLVRGAVGIDDKRGDLVTVEAIPFPPAPPAEVTPAAAAAAAAAALPFWKRPQVIAGAGLGAAVLIGVVVALVTGKRRKKERAAKEALEAEERAAEEKRIADEKKAAEDKRIADEKKAAEASTEDLRAMAQERALTDPATAALVIRAWLEMDAVAEPPAEEAPTPTRKAA
jgi:flagellar M-ring protein FliF